MVERAQTHRQEPRAFWLRGRLDKLINLCLLPPALFLDMQTLPSSKARGIRWADRTSRVWLLPGPEAWPDAGTCARALRGPAPHPGVCRWSRCLPRRGPPRAGPLRCLWQETYSSPGAWGRTTTHLGPCSELRGGQAPRTLASTFLPTRFPSQA